MGMYTQIRTDLQLIGYPSDDVVGALQALIRGEDPGGLASNVFDRCQRVSALMTCSDCGDEPVGHTLEMDRFGFSWYMQGFSALKNYDGEIETFFRWIAPHCKDGRIGSSQYEEDDDPTHYLVSGGNLSTFTRRRVHLTAPWVGFGY